MKILLALMTVLIGPLSLITLRVSINNIVNMRPTEPGWVNITTVGWWDYQELLQDLQSVCHTLADFWERILVKSKLSNF